MYKNDISLEKVNTKSRSDKIMEAKRAFAYDDNYDNDFDNTYEKKHPFSLLRLITAGMLFLILGIAFYNNFSYNGFNKDYVIECLNKSSYWNSIVKVVGDIANKAVGLYNSLK